MRDRRCEALKRFITILLFQYLTLQVNLVNILSHILEVNCNGRALQVVNFLGSNHGVCLRLLYLVLLSPRYINLVRFPLRNVELSSLSAFIII